jgi:hypothetical protein
MTPFIARVFGMPARESPHNSAGTQSLPGIRSDHRAARGTQVQEQAPNLKHDSPGKPQHGAPGMCLRRAGDFRTLRGRQASRCVQMVLHHSNSGRAQGLCLSDRKVNGAIRLRNNTDLRPRSIARLKYNDSRLPSNSARLPSFPHRDSTEAPERGLGAALARGEAVASTVAEAEAAVVDKSGIGWFRAERHDDVINLPALNSSNAALS